MGNFSRAGFKSKKFAMIFDRFKRGPVAADLGEVAFTSVEDAQPDVWDGEDGDNAELMVDHHVDPAHVLAHDTEVPE